MLVAWSKSARIPFSIRGRWPLRSRLRWRACLPISTSLPASLPHTIHTCSSAARPSLFFSEGIDRILTSIRAWRHLARRGSRARGRPRRRFGRSPGAAAFVQRVPSSPTSRSASRTSTASPHLKALRAHFTTVREGAVRAAGRRRAFRRLQPRPDVSRCTSATARGRWPTSIALGFRRRVCRPTVSRSNRTPGPSATARRTCRTTTSQTDIRTGDRSAPDQGGMRHSEASAYARRSRRRHNLVAEQFSNYLGIGAARISGFSFHDPAFLHPDPHQASRTVHRYDPSRMHPHRRHSHTDA